MNGLLAFLALAPVVAALVVPWSGWAAVVVFAGWAALVFEIWRVNRWAVGGMPGAAGPPSISRGR